MSTIVISGRLGEKVETRETSAGPVLKFSIAENYYANKEKQTRWWDCSVFGKRGETLAKLGIGKGDAVTVIGEFATREHNGKTYFQCTAFDVQLQGKKQSNGDAAPYGKSAAGSSAKHSAPAEDDGDLPF